MKAKKVGISRLKKTLQVSWQDGTVAEYSFIMLREACPCADCRTAGDAVKEPGKSDLLTIPLVPKEIHEIKRVTQVGNYALQIDWDDGHNAGIYPWDYLYSLKQSVSKNRGE